MDRAVVPGSVLPLRFDLETLGIPKDSAHDRLIPSPTHT